MADFSLEERFPDMKPIQSAPTLWLAHGIGTTVYGTRDYDPDTGTYVKTRCITVVFLPLWCLGAYRVADAPGGGWYFLGKVPLSALARAWNILIVLLIAGGIGTGLWLKHINSPDYIAGQKLAEGDRLAAAGQLGQAAKLYAEVARGTTSHAGTAVGKIEALLEGPAEGAAPQEVAEALSIAVDLALDQPGQLGGVYQRGLALAEKHGKDRPQDALRLLEALAPLTPDPAKLAEKQIPLLENLVAAEPKNFDHVCRLALAYESCKQLGKCEKLLAPHRPRLGDSEGARILGLVRANEGKLEEAEQLLAGYAEGRLEKLQGLAQNLRDAGTALEQQILRELKSQRAAGFDYARHKQAGRDEQARMVSDYFLQRLKEDQGIRQAQAALRRERHVVGAALDLGMVTLRRAQTLPEAERKAALGRAEKTFLAVRGVAGKSPEVNLSLGEVYYWLGKQAQGKKLFDELLQERARDVDILLKVGTALRRVGAMSEARRLTEEAYERGPTPEFKHKAALFRSLLRLDTDDEILWLERSTQTAPEVRAALSTARGRKAADEGKEDEAAGHLRAAVAEYARLPRSAGSLNNSALALVELYRFTGDPADFKRARTMTEEALNLQPSDSILLQNAASLALDAAFQEVLDGALDLKALKGRSGPHLLPYLYSDRAGRDRVVQRLRDNPTAARSAQHGERLLILAPRDPLGPTLLLGLYTATGDNAALERLGKWLRLADLDLEPFTKETLKQYQGQNREKQRTDYTTQVARWRKAVEAARPGGGATRAAATAELVLELIRADGLELPLDADEAVRLAEEADKAAPSRGTRSCLISALLSRGGRTLAEQDATYKAWTSKARRALGHRFLVALALSESGKLRERALANADVRRAVDLVRQEAQAFPDEPSVWAWAMLKEPHPKDAALVAKALAGDDRGRLLQQLAQQVAPLNAPAVLNDYWLQRLAGNEAEARAVLQQAAQRGIPLPFDGKQ